MDNGRMQRGHHVALRRVAGVLALASFASTGVAEAQEPTAAVVVAGVDDVSRVRDPVMGALRARGYAPVPQDSIDAAVAFALSGQPVDESNAAALREALSVTVLYVVDVRPADEAASFFSLQRVVAEGATSAYGRATGAELAGAVVQQLLTLEARTAAASGHELPSTEQAIGSDAAAAQPESAAEPPPGEGEGTAPADASSSERSASDGGSSAVGGLAAGLLVWWGITGAVAAGICDNHGAGNCVEAFFIGAVPLGGPLIFALEEPSGPLDDAEVGAMVAMGLVQLALLIPIPIIAMSSGGGEPSGEPATEARFVPYVTPHGGGVAAAGTF